MLWRTDIAGLRAEEFPEESERWRRQSRRRRRRAAYLVVSADSREEAIQLTGDLADCAFEPDFETTRQLGLARFEALRKEGEA